MVVTDRTPDGGPGATAPAGLRLDRWARPTLPALEPTMPLLVAGAVLAGLVLALAMTPIGSGDYGQWLMTSRAFLGEPVPAYRDLGEVPPLVPGLLAAIRVVVADPVAALHVLATILLLGLGAAFFGLGAIALGTRWGGALAVVIGLLVTDRYTDLFAFGGLLQVAALALGCVAIAAIIRAARDPLVERGWWWLAAGTLGLTAVTHVGTGIIFVPIGLALTGIVALSVLARSGWEPARLVDRLLLPGLAFAAIGLYWLLVLVPAGGDYVTNPASLAYRGPDRLWADLFDRWPTAVVIVVGAAALAIGTLRSIVLRRVDGLLLVGAWAALAWAVLGWSLFSGSATDFPRFVTPLLAPLVIGAAAAVLWALSLFAASLRDLGWNRSPSIVIGAAVVLVVVVAAPLTIARHQRQSAFYELRDPDALAAAAAWIDAELPAGAAVLADVREAKWIEGLVGRPALFSQPVRYAFRPAEWQRSTDADALLRSTLALTSGYVAAQFTDQLVAPGGEPVLSGLLVRANHGGEFVDLLMLQRSAIQVDTLTGASLRPVRATEIVSDRQAGVRTVWGLDGNPTFSFTQTVTVFEEGTTLRLVQEAPGHRISTDLLPATGMTITSLEVHPDEAIACFTALGGSEPCIRLRTSDGKGVLAAGGDGGVRVSTDWDGQIELLITALTPGEASIGLGVLRPAELVETYEVGAVLLHEPDPAFGQRLRRLEALGFSESRAFGPYRVLLRDGVGS
jgi:hypothetical protein